MEATNLKLHIGSGSQYREGWVNIDVNPVGDVVADMRALPFRDGVFTRIAAHSVVEHTPRGADGRGLWRMFEEWNRVSANGARIEIRVPHVSSVLAFGSMDHHYYFDSETLDVLDNSKAKPSDGYDARAPFEWRVRSELVMGDYGGEGLWRILRRPANRWRWFAERYMCRFVPINEVKYDITVRKREKENRVGRASAAGMVRREFLRRVDKSSGPRSTRTSASLSTAHELGMKVISSWRYCQKKNIKA